MSDAAVQRLGARVGPQRIFDALDRATALHSELLGPAAESPEPGVA
jgi:hypothetical protein